MHLRTRLLGALWIVTGALTLAAAENAAVGTWQVVSDSPDGVQYKWTMIIEEDNGKLSGTLSGGPGSYPLVEPRLEGDTFTCKVIIDENAYAIQVKISGAKLEGTWKGPSSQGTIKGTKQA